jgi:hypothetical protein
VNEKIAHEVQGRNLDGFHTQAGATRTGADFGGNFYQFDVLHNEVNL